MRLSSGLMLIQAIVYSVSLVWGVFFKFFLWCSSCWFVLLPKFCRCFCACC